MQLINKSPEDRIISAVELQVEIKKFRDEHPFAEVKSKIPSLDKLLAGGFRTGNLVLLSGGTAVGKSQTFMTFSKSFEEQGFKCLWFPFELKQEEFLERWEKCGVVNPNFYLPRRITDETWAWTKAKIEEGIKNFGINIVFIDDIGSMDRQGMTENDFYSWLIREIKSFARSRSLIIFIIQHTRKDFYDRVPQMQDIKSSGDLPNKSDIVLMIWRKRKDQKRDEIYDEGIQLGTKTILDVTKVRRLGGKTGFVHLHYGDNFLYTEEDVFPELEEKDDVDKLFE